MNKYEIKCISTYGWDKGEKYTDEYKANSLVEAWEEWKRKHSPGWANYNIGGIYKEDNKGSTTSFLVLYGSSHDVDAKIKSGKYVNDSKVKDETKIMWGADKVKDKDKIDKLIQLGATSSDLGKYILLRGPISIFVKGLGMSEEKIRMYANMDMSTINIDDSKHFTKQEIKDLHKLADALKIKDSKVKDVKLRISFDNNADTNRAVEFLKSKNVKADMVFDTTIDAYFNDTKDWNCLETLKSRYNITKQVILLDSVKDGGFQEIGNYWRSLANKNKMSMQQMDDIYKEFTKTSDFQNWELKNSMDIIYSENMFTKFMEFFKRKTGKTLITDSIKPKDSLKSFKVNGKIVKATDERDAVKKFRDDDVVEIYNGVKIYKYDSGFYVILSNGQQMTFSTIDELKKWLDSRLKHWDL